MFKRWQSWALLFGCMLAMILPTALNAAEAPPPPAASAWRDEGVWLPEGTSTYAADIDDMFMKILYLTGAIFALTEGLLIVFMIRYRRQHGRKSVYSHGNHTLELFWTITPFAILLGIALYQKTLWEHIKKDIDIQEKDPKAVHIQLYAEQFAWNFRYPGNDKKFGTSDDPIEYKKLFVPVNRPIVIEQTSKDVIHSFFLPNMRLKQDVVPGLQIKVWFQATKTTKDMQKTRTPDWNYEIACAELCGSDHSQMRGEMYVLDDADYEAWAKKESEAFDGGDKEATTPIFNNWLVDENGVRVFDRKEEEKHNRLPSEGAHHGAEGETKAGEKKADEKKPADEKKKD